MGTINIHDKVKRRQNNKRTHGAMMALAGRKAVLTLESQPSSWLFNSRADREKKPERSMGFLIRSIKKRKKVLPVKGSLGKKATQEG